MLICKTCGQEFAHIAGRRGQPPKHCPTCRKPSSGPIDPTAARERRAGVQRDQRASEKAQASEAVAELRSAARLATALGGFTDTRSAALSVGLDLPRKELKRLEKIARASFPELVEGGLLGAAAFVTRAATLLTQLAVERAHLMAPRDLPMAARNLIAVREILLGDGAPKHPFSSFEIVIKGPDGQRIEVPANEAVSDGVTVQ